MKSKILHFFMTLLLFLVFINLCVFAQDFFPSMPIVKTGFEYGTKTNNLFDEDLDTFIEYDYKNVQFQLIQEVFDNLFWNFKYKIQDYAFYNDSSKNKVVNYFYNKLKFKPIKNLTLSFNLNYKFLNYNDDIKNYSYLYPGISIKYNIKTGSYLYFSYHLYYRFGSMTYFDYQIHRFYLSFKYNLNSLDFKINGSYNYQINFTSDTEKYNKFSVGIFLTYDFNN